MKLFKELVKEFDLQTIDEQIDKWLEVNEKRNYLSFKQFKTVFYTNYKVKQTSSSEAVLGVLFYCFCLKQSKRGIGIQDLDSRFSNVYFRFLNDMQIKGYCNSPAPMQTIDFNSLSQNFDSEGYECFKNYLFYNYAIKDIKFKYFNNLGQEPQIYASYGNKLDIISYCIDTIAENFEGHKNNKIRKNVYKMNFNTNLDNAGLITRFGEERFDTIRNITLVINPENYSNNEILEVCENYTKEKFLIAEAKYESR